MDNYYISTDVDIGPQLDSPQKITLHTCAADTISSKIYCDNSYLGQ